MISAESAASKAILGVPPTLRFAMPTKAKGKVIWGRFITRRAIWAGATVLLLLCFAIGAVLYQKYQLGRLEKEWAAISPQVASLEELRERFRAAGPWHSNTPETLVLLRALTEAFPAQGTVWATSIKQAEEVTVSGKATNREEWLATQDRLRQTPGVEDLRILQTRGTPDAREPMTFSLRFAWNSGATDAR